MNIPDNEVELLIPDSEVVVETPKDKTIGMAGRVVGETVGALAGEKAGAAVGSSFGPVGTLAGGYVGGALGAGSATYGMDLAEGKSQGEAALSGAKSAAMQLVIPAGVKLGAKAVKGGANIAMEALGPTVEKVAEKVLNLSAKAGRELATYATKIAGVEKSAVLTLIEEPVTVMEKIRKGVDADDLLDASEALYNNTIGNPVLQKALKSIVDSDNPYRRSQELLGTGKLAGITTKDIDNVYDYLLTFSAVKFSPLFRKMGAMEAIATTGAAGAGHLVGGVAAPALTPGLVLLSPRGMASVITNAMAVEGTLTHGALRALKSDAGQKALISLTDELTNTPKE